MGITLANKNGDMPRGVSSWQFNLSFNIDIDKYAPDSLKMLQESGLDFTMLKSEKAIPPKLFAERFMISGLCCNPRVTWITFHGGMDFGYLLKCISGQELPEHEPEFF